MKYKKALKDIIDAWEALPGNHVYTADEIEDWLSKDMKPVINKARKLLNPAIRRKK